MTKKFELNVEDLEKVTGGKNFIIGSDSLDILDGPDFIDPNKGIVTADDTYSLTGLSGVVGFYKEGRK